MSIDVAEETKIKREELAPQFITKLEAREVLAYQEVILECRVTGIPEPEVTWYQVTTASAFHTLSCEFMRMSSLLF